MADLRHARPRPAPPRDWTWIAALAVLAVLAGLILADAIYSAVHTFNADRL